MGFSFNEYFISKVLERSPKSVPFLFFFLLLYFTELMFFFICKLFSVRKIKKNKEKKFKLLSNHFYKNI